MDLLIRAFIPLLRRQQRPPIFGAAGDRRDFVRGGIRRSATCRQRATATASRVTANRRLFVDFATQRELARARACTRLDARHFAVDGVL